MLGNDSLRYERLAEHIVVLTIDRPDARNAIDGLVTAGLDAALKATEADNDIQVVILTGTGEQAFCAGADLKAIARGDGASLSTATGGFAGLTRARRTKVWIAAVNGAALAGGCELALACDLIVASSGATFGLPEPKRGLIAAAGGVFRLIRSLPRAIALELIATGDHLTASRAFDFGFVNHVVPADAVLDAALSLAKKITANAPLAVRESLMIAREAASLDESSLWSLSDQAYRRIRATEDFREGPKAFLEKRLPRWQGR